MGVSDSENNREEVAVTTHHPVSTAAKNLARAVREHEQQPSPETTTEMLRKLRELHEATTDTENEVLAEASRWLSTHRIAGALGYASHTPIRRKLNRIRDDRSEGNVP